MILFDRCTDIWIHIKRFYNVVFSKIKCSGKNEFIVSMAVHHIPGLLITLHKKSFLRIIKNCLTLQLYFHNTYSTLWNCDHLSITAVINFKINFKTTFHVLLLCIHICEIDCKKWLVHFNIRNFMRENCQFSFHFIFIFSILIYYFA